MELIRNRRVRGRSSAALLERVSTPAMMPAGPDRTPAAGGARGPLAPVLRECHPIGQEEGAESGGWRGDRDGPRLRGRAAARLGQGRRIQKTKRNGRHEQSRSEATLRARRKGSSGLPVVGVPVSESQGAVRLEARCATHTPPGLVNGRERLSPRD
ncbi:hypothetical protein GCM10027360_75100 [Amycolatopsis echigonensis]